MEVCRWMKETNDDTRGLEWNRRTEIREDETKDDQRNGDDDEQDMDGEKTENKERDLRVSERNDFSITVAETGR
jgi:hypothetical protein